MLNLPNRSFFDTWARIRGHRANPPHPSTTTCATSWRRTRSHGDGGRIRAGSAGYPTETRTCSTLASSTKGRFSAEGLRFQLCLLQYNALGSQGAAGGSGKEAEHMKVAVVGYAGSGKSTFARRLGDVLCIPVQHLDQVFYTSNWQERDKGEARDLAEAFLDVNDAWVVDGTYHRLALARRLEAADVIVIFAFPRRTCLAQAWRRSRRYAHRVRPDMADGCIERLDAEFVLWLVWKGRTRSHRKRFEEIRRDYAEKAVVVRSRDEVERLFCRLAASPS